MWLYVLLLVVLVLLMSSRERFNPATERPTAADESVVAAVASYTGLKKDTDMTKINSYISQVQSFYDSKYLPTKETPSSDQIKAFTGPITDPQIDKVKLGQILEYMFLSTGQPPPPSPTNPTSVGTAGGQGTGGTSTSSAGPTSGGTAGGGIPGRKVWGPEYPGMGDGGAQDEDSTGRRKYPELVGPGGDSSTLYPGSGVGAPSKSWQLSMDGSLPGSGSLGSDENSKYLPFSRTPGDQDLVPNPYSISSTYTTSNYSSKTEPVPFLADFSAFQK
jgi:hypothetical protein